MFAIYSHAILKTPEGKFLMQSRGYNPGITNPGGISLFGGGQEGSETPLECLLRELDEELELKVGPDEVSLLWITEGVSPDKVTPAKRYIYLIKNIVQDTLILHEGDAIIPLTFEEIQTNPAVPEGVRKRFMEYKEELLRA